MAFIKTLKDKINNIVYPQTHAKAVAMDDTDTLDDLNKKLLRAEDLINVEDLPVSELPIATTESLGIVKIGTGLAVDPDGTIYATGSAVADYIAWDKIIGKPELATKEYVDNLIGSAETTLTQIDSGEGIS